MFTYIWRTQCEEQINIQVCPRYFSQLFPVLFLFKNFIFVIFVVPELDTKNTQIPIESKFYEDRNKSSDECVVLTSSAIENEFDLVTKVVERFNVW